MSPRSTKALHESRHFQHLAAIGLISFEYSNLLGECFALL